MCIEQEIKALLFVNNMSRQEQFELSTFLAETKDDIDNKNNSGTIKKGDERKFE